MSGLSFVTLLAYDYRFAASCIASYYDIADEIILGVDADRLSWSGNKFELDLAQIRAELAAIDPAKKIKIVEDDFHSQASPTENDTHERSILSWECREENWVVQIDADEILLNAREFRDWMLARERAGADQEAPAGCVMATWTTVFKIFGNKALVIDPAFRETPPVATRLRGQYVIARHTDEAQELSPLELLHYSFGRTPEEVLQKLNNWSHSRDFDTDAFFQMWQSVTLANYREYRNIHPLNGTNWPGLVEVDVRG